MKDMQPILVRRAVENSCLLHVMDLTNGVKTIPIGALVNYNQKNDCYMAPSFEKKEIECLVNWCYTCLAIFQSYVLRGTVQNILERTEMLICFFHLDTCDIFPFCEIAFITLKRAWDDFKSKSSSVDNHLVHNNLHQYLIFKTFKTC